MNDKEVFKWKSAICEFLGEEETSFTFKQGVWSLTVDNNEAHYEDHQHFLLNWRSYRIEVKYTDDEKGEYLMLKMRKFHVI